uniref:AP180 N-terminal homology (ANTH) domain-containing protein n=1 Tax=Parascaris equorum TaxID=6256 RepID=A0A914SI22_PAREQ
MDVAVTVFNAMDVVRWSSLVPQGQCLLAPLILVILDTSKFYDYLVKIIFKLHEHLDTYQSPQAYLHGDNVSEGDTPPDGRSVDESLVDVSEPQTIHQEEEHTVATDPRFVALCVLSE